MNPNAFVDLTHEDPALTGRVAFHRPSTLESISIASRKTALAFQQFPKGTEPDFDNLPFELRAGVGMIATLERVIDTAPTGFYTTDSVTKQPFLNPGKVQDESVLWTVYAAYTVYVESFLPGRNTQSVAGSPADEADLAGSQSTES